MKATGQTIRFKSKKEFNNFIKPAIPKEETMLEKRLERIEKKLKENETRIDNCWIEIIKPKVGKVRRG